jgi:hypothetical protein
MSDSRAETATLAPSSGQFRKKPVVIEARQLGHDYDQDCEIIRWAGARAAGELYGPNAVAVIPTLEGEHVASTGDWIIRGVYGEFYPCKPDIFAATYEPVTQTTQRPHELFVRCSTEFVEMIQGKPSFPVTIQIEKVENGELFFVATRHECTPRRDDVTATEIEAIALQYDRECRGGIGRGDIDLELAQRLAAWFNALLAPAAAGR